MNCSKCNTTMEEGYIPVMRGKLQWVPKGVATPLLTTSLATNAIPLTKTAMMSYKRKTAFHCSQCHLITMSTIKEYE